MLPRTHLKKVQRSLYDGLKTTGRHYLGQLTPALRRYYQEYQKEFRSYESVASKSELTQELVRAQLVFCGDYHTLAQAQRTVIRLLRELAPELKAEHRRLVLALEMLRPEDEKAAADFLAGEIDEKRFLTRIHFHRNWGFRWPSYRQLFEFARRHGISVRGLNCGKGRGAGLLAQRDAFAAHRLVDLVEGDPDATVFVLMGDLHLAERHLPLATDRAMANNGLRVRRVTVHQNIERFYWQLVEKNLEHRADVLRVRAGVYCVMNTPPWVKLQSQVKWAEGVASGYSGGDYTDLSHPAHEDCDYADELVELLEVLSGFLELPPSDLPDFHLVTPLNLTTWENYLQRLRLPERSVAELFAAELPCFFVADANLLFLKSLSVNHLASLCGQLLFHQSHSTPSPFQGPTYPFYGQLWSEAVGYFCSKILNPKRKCNGPADLLASLQTSPTRALAIAVMNLRAEGILPKSTSLEAGGSGAEKVGPSQVLAQFKAARILGKILGEAIYRGVVDNEVSRADLRRLFNGFAGDEAAAKATYLDWVDLLDAHQYRLFAKSAQL